MKNFPSYFLPPHPAGSSLTSPSAPSHLSKTSGNPPTHRFSKEWHMSNPPTIVQALCTSVMITKLNNHTSKTKTEKKEREGRKGGKKPLIDLIN